MQAGYNVLVPDICRDAMPEVVLPAMDALQALGHTPVVLSMQSAAAMYQEYRYAKHGCYEIFHFYYKNLLKEHHIDYGFSTGLLGILEDLSKGETHHLLEEAGIPNLLYLHCRDTKAVKRILDMGALEWRFTFIACSAPELAGMLAAAGMALAEYAPPATSLRLFYPESEEASGKPYALRSTDPRLSEGFDVSFAGTWSSERERLVADLTNAGITVAVFGDDGWAGGAVAGNYRGRANYLTELNTIYNASRVVLDLPHPECELQGYLSGRVVDALAAGAFVLTYEREEFPAVLDPRTDLAVFQREAGLVEEVQHYLESDFERQRIASRGHLKAVETCTWAARLGRLIPRLEVHSLRAS